MAPRQTRLAVAAGAVVAEAAMVAWLLAADGLAWLDGAWPGLGAATVAVGLRAGLRWAAEGGGARLADTRAGLAAPWRWPTLGRAVLRQAVAAAAALALLAALAALWPGHWLAAWAVWSAVELSRHGLSPMIAAHLFDHAEPLAEGALRARLHAMLTRAGLGDCALRVTGGQAASRRLNARFVGLGGVRCILLSHALVTALPAAQVAAVVAHEAGHGHHRHLEQWLAAKLAAALAVFAAVAPLFALLPLSPPAVVAAVWLLAPLCGFALRPLPAALRRRWEHQADAFAARHAGAAAMADALATIDRANLAGPDSDRLYAAFTAFHPATGDRLARLAPEIGA